jgi:hypothetical protein
MYCGNPEGRSESRANAHQASDEASEPQDQVDNHDGHDESNKGVRPMESHQLASLPSQTAGSCSGDATAILPAPRPLAVSPG